MSKSRASCGSAVIVSAKVAIPKNGSTLQNQNQDTNTVPRM